MEVVIIRAEETQVPRVVVCLAIKENLYFVDKGAKASTRPAWLLCKGGMHASSVSNWPVPAARCCPSTISSRITSALRPPTAVASPAAGSSIAGERRKRRRSSRPETLQHTQSHVKVHNLITDYNMSASKT